MQQILKPFLILIALLMLSGCPATKQSGYNGSGHSNSGYAGDSLTRTGEISSSELISRYIKFAHHYESYQQDQTEADNFARLKNIEIIVFFGLWCHDSQRELPRLLKLLEASNFPKNKLKLITIDTNKTVPSEYAEQFKVKYTPTIFVTQNNQIIAKVVEKPKETLAKDILAQILR